MKITRPNQPLLTEFTHTLACAFKIAGIQNCFGFSLNSTLRRSLDAVGELKRFFERNGPIVDSEMRDVFVRNIPRAIVSSEQRDIVEEQVSLEYKQRGRGGAAPT